MRKENLVAYNADRIIKDVKFADQNGYYLDGFKSTDQVIHILDFIKEEILRNYNPEADLKCDYCKEHFTGIRAYDHMISHQVKEHEDYCSANMVLFFGILSCVIDGIANYKRLYEETGSEVALTLHKLHRKGKDLPSELLKQYYLEWDEYMDLKDPEMKWHRHGDYSYLDEYPVVAGRNTVIKETIKSIWNIFHPKNTGTPKISQNGGSDQE